VRLHDTENVLSDGQRGHTVYSVSMSSLAG
jgi:hypothetical protein